ncbi:dimethylarginine dimethylaminohydrolase family protein [Usitatibacter palustris]|uniref:N(G),N(G)-dimethylarginine dimethylaminohydrolase n=1 Tax=Usitatibacter palustris TaxID=2732487 RepID=A0A6M4H663_9PROT|nr:arginine deiminase-related protein [Usitatibacter palustris]QJR14685.1 N(G),N(G)-dimethylarginine dimethylaminohydrolase [Usitatibacter palustris]
MQRTRHVFLMCPPEFFDVSYIINPWMHGNVRKIDNALAKKQWRSLYDVLCDLATVRLVLPQPGTPDMVFTANAGLLRGNTFLVSRFRYPERQAEEPYFADWFMDRGFDVTLMPRDMPFEGAGDALFDRGGNRLWMAYGHRSVLASKAKIEKCFDTEVVPLKLTDQRFYHLDTCFCALEGGNFIYYPPAFDAASQKTIEKRIPAAKRIAISEEDALAFACNAVNAGKTLVVNRASAAFVADLGAKGYDVVQTPLTEFMKAGGSAKCLTLRLDEPAPA